MSSVKSENTKFRGVCQDHSAKMFVSKELLEEIESACKKYHFPSRNEFLALMLKRQVYDLEKQYSSSREAVKRICGGAR